MTKLQRRRHDSGASREQADLASRVPEQHGGILVEASITDVRDERGRRLGRVGMVDEQRLVTRKHRLRLTRRVGGNAVPSADEVVVDLDVRTIEQHSRVESDHRRESLDDAPYLRADVGGGIVGAHADDARRELVERAARHEPGLRSA
jgi:hypothetical protein